MDIRLSREEARRLIQKMERILDHRPAVCLSVDRSAGRFVVGARSVPEPYYAPNHHHTTY